MIFAQIWNALKGLATWARLKVVDLSSTDQVLPAGSTGLFIAAAGDVKFDALNELGAAATFTAPAPVGLFPVAGITKIYKVGTTATVSFAGYPA